MDFDDHAGALLNEKLERDQMFMYKSFWRIDVYCLFRLDRLISVVSIGDRNQSVTSVELVRQKTFRDLKKGDCV